MGAEVIVGDCRDVLAGMAPASVDAVVCDPPYELGFMGKSWDQRGVAFDPATWEAVRRVMRPGAALLAFGAPRTYHRLTCAVEDAGFEIKDCLMWLFGQGFPKHKSRLKPAYEPILFARKPGPGWLNVDGCRIAIETLGPGARYTPAGKGNVGSGGVYAGGYSGAYVGPAGPHPDSVHHDARGRWPANVVLGCACEGDGHDPDCAVALLDDQAGERRSGTMKGRYKGGSTKGIFGEFGYADKDYEATAGGASRFFLNAAWAPGEVAEATRFRYESKASSTEREAGLATLPRRVAGVGNTDAGTGRNPANPRNAVAASARRRVERGEPPTLPRANHHPTVKPCSLMRWLCRLVTPPGGVICDPFAGSGSTGCAAVLEGFDFMGIEMDEDYAEIARRRIAHWGRQAPLPLPAVAD